MSKVSDLEARNTIINMILNVLVKQTFEVSGPIVWMKVEELLEPQLNDLMKQRVIYDYFILCDGSMNSKDGSKITCTVRAQTSPSERYQDYAVAIDRDKKGKDTYEVLG